MIAAVVLVNMRSRYSPMIVVMLLLSFGAATGWSRHKQKLRAELADLQEKTGLTLAQVDYFGVDLVSFEKRSGLPVVPLHNFKQVRGFLSPDGEYLGLGLPDKSSRKRLAIVRRDGSKLYEYPELEDPGYVCWSQDKSKLVLSASIPAEPHKSGLILLDLKTGATRPIEAEAFAETQCFSPDGGAIVYQSNFSMDKHHYHGDVKIYDLASGTSHDISRGLYPTWSPRGEIAYLDDDSRTYFLIGPVDGVKKRLFKSSSAYSALWWSPDARFVAYNVLCCIWKSLLYVADIGRLRVRRLEDNADDWVDEVSWNSGSYGWIQSAPSK
jgi:hypothetical protein